MGGDPFWFLDWTRGVQTACHEKRRGIPRVFHGRCDEVEVLAGTFGGDVCRGVPDFSKTTVSFPASGARGAALGKGIQIVKLGARSSRWIPFPKDAPQRVFRRE
jgi:hypothetical protein